MFHIHPYHPFGMLATLVVLVLVLVLVTAGEAV